MPLWIQLIIDALLIFGVPFEIGFVVHISRVKAQRLPERRIPATEQLAMQAARSEAHADETIRIQLADKAFIELLQEYNVAMPSKQAREIALYAAFHALGK
jgi:hypothetical protein